MIASAWELRVGAHKASSRLRTAISARSPVAHLLAVLHLIGQDKTVRLAFPAARRGKDAVSARTLAAHRNPVIQ
jgi:hypothetical protein